LQAFIRKFSLLGEVVISMASKKLQQKPVISSLMVFMIMKQVKLITCTNKN